MLHRGIIAVFLAALVFCAGCLQGARAEDDIIVETEEQQQQFKTASEIVKEAGSSTGDAPTEEAATNLVTGSPDADTTVYFTYPLNSKEIPTNKPVRLLIGFRNRGAADMMVDYLDASLRYPMDYSYIITNFTAVRFSRHVPAQQEATFDYGFYLHEAFAARPFTLNINLHYHDAADKLFVSAVYNDTIQVVELDEGLDSQTFFLYIMLAAVVSLLGLLGYQYTSARSKKRFGGVKKAVKASVSAAGSGSQVESGTSRSGDVDYDWLPESTLRAINKSPKKSPVQSRSPQQSPSAKKKL
ncbi:translocon-associated protein subunit alpha-like [Paramacrobiotus metropolitanus]|uniref:translocon-associated protein subunit alpha-like n=1 Tax=Paramacrobiotus metropolitanus TaxID=2943436 RepID=UPI002446537C|nr:translocon-associated protein subunit alpha-like [Paramacrobiotus metropolitanus]